MSELAEAIKELNQLSKEVVQEISNDDELIDAMSKLARERLSRLNEIREDDNKQKLNSLPPHVTAAIIHKNMAAFKPDGKDGTLVYLYSISDGIYKSSENFVQKIVQGIFPAYKKNDVKEVLYSLNRLTSTKPIEDSKTLVPLNNGVYDIEAKRLLPFSPNYRFISKIATNFNEAWINKEPEIKRPNGEIWTPSKFIDELACGDTEISHLLMQVVADAINGNFSHKQAIFLVGSQLSTMQNGSNGKGTFQELIIAICGGENVAQLKVTDLGGANKTNYVAGELQGKTCNIGDDIQAGAYVDDSSDFNSAVTGDRLRSDVKYGSPVYFYFKGAVIQSTNGMPRYKNRTGGTYRRMVLVPFNAHFEDNGDNMNIKDDYVKRQDVREWFVVQALQLGYFAKFDIPAVSSKMIDDYKVENDPTRQFYNDVFVEYTESTITTQKIYSDYQAWATDNGIKMLFTQKALTKELTGILNEPQKNITKIDMSSLKQILDDPTNSDLIRKYMPISNIIFKKKDVKQGGRTIKGFVFPLRKDVEALIDLNNHLQKLDTSKRTSQLNKIEQIENRIVS